MWEHLPPRFRLRGTPHPGERNAMQLSKDFERFRDGLPRPLESYVLTTYGIDLTSVYGGLRVKNPFGKASGQLSLARHQVERDAASGLGFVVLKTVIAQDRRGEQTKILEWLGTVPRLVHRAAPGQVHVGLKIFNALFEDEFQLRMLDAVEAAPPGEERADFLAYANRLFDPAKQFEGKVGVAYGGPDLSG